MYEESHNWPHRTFCDVLHEMRKILERPYNGQIDILLSMVEELQVYGNRMEAGLSYTSDLNKLHDKRKKLLKQIEDLKKETPVDDKKVT